MLRDGQTKGLKQPAGYVWESGEPFYGTRVGPGWYQSGAGVAKGYKLPFSVLRMLMNSENVLPLFFDPFGPSGCPKCPPSCPALAPPYVGLERKGVVKCWSDEEVDAWPAG